MDGTQHGRIASFIWGIADDVLRDLYVRGKYRDVILPMTVLRRLDAVLEPTKQAVLETKAHLNSARITNQDGPLRQAAGQAFYNASKFTLRDLLSRASQQKLRADFEAYLDGFSPNVQEILDNFEFRNQIPRLSKADALGALIEKFLDPRVNLSPHPIGEAPGLDNHGMGTVFEELVRRFNEENNEEAGEHWTPRDAVKLMARLMFLPIADQIESGTYLLYDGAVGTGGMLTVAEETLKQLAEERGKQVETHLYGQEINAETYAICKADLLLKGEGEEADNVVGGPEYSTLSNDAFPSREFDFMLSNPPYGKSWKSDIERMGGKQGIKDPRFIIEHANSPEYSLVTRSSDGQMMFLANMLSKMKHETRLGSRVAEVHNGSSLFTGDAGQGESNIRRWIIESDWLEAIVALPPNMFYNTPIATFIWVVSNRKPQYRRGKVQLLDATQWFKPLRKHLGMKTCMLGDDDIERIVETFLAFEESPQCKILPNEAFGYWKISVSRPLRIQGADPDRTYSPKEIKAFRESGSRAEDGVPVIRRIHKVDKAKADPLHGLFPVTIDGNPVVVEYEPDAELNAAEQVPFQESEGVSGFMAREVLPHYPDAWTDDSKALIGYEINWYRYFAKPKKSRPLTEVRGEILKSEQATTEILADVYRTMSHGARSGKKLKPSGQSWLGDVPEHWELVPLHTLLRLRKQVVGVKSDEFKLLSLTLNGIVPRDLENPQGKFPADFSTYQIVEPGDLVFCLFDMDETPRTVGLTGERGMITGAYTVFECLDPATAEYLYLFFLAMDQHKRLRPLYTSLRKVIPKEVLLRIKVPVPPKDELESILKFVTSEVTKLGEAIRRAQQGVALLKEYRARMIGDVVVGDFDVRAVADRLPDHVDTGAIQAVAAGEGNEKGDSEPVPDIEPDEVST